MGGRLWQPGKLTFRRLKRQFGVNFPGLLIGARASGGRAAPGLDENDRDGLSHIEGDVLRRPVRRLDVVSAPATHFWTAYWHAQSSSEDCRKRQQRRHAFRGNCDTPSIPARSYFPAHNSQFCAGKRYSFQRCRRPRKDLTVPYWMASRGGSFGLPPPSPLIRPEPQLAAHDDASSPVQRPESQVDGQQRAARGDFFAQRRP
jgi:hypothetical protein